MRAATTPESRAPVNLPFRIDEEELRDAVRRPALIWGWRICPEKGDLQPVADCRAVQDGFRWFHLNLADVRSANWIADLAELPAPARDALIEPDRHPRVGVEGGALWLALDDFERDFDSGRQGGVAALHIALTRTLLITGRHHPLACADAIRARIEAGVPFGDPASALDLLVGTMIAGHEGQVLNLTAELLAQEDELLDHGDLPAIGALVGIRRRAARLHRIVGSMRTTLQRLEREPLLPEAIRAVVIRQHERVQRLEADVLAAQAQLRLLREELDLQTAQRTDANLYLLSIVSALLLPATLVTGFFGMNTGGLPLTQNGHGTLVGTIVAIAASGATYLVLRAKGMIRR